MKKEKQCYDFNPIHWTCNEVNDEWFLLNVYYACSCINSTLDCCCVVNMNDIYNGVQLFKVFWKAF